MADRLGLVERRAMLPQIVRFRGEISPGRREFLSVVERLLNAPLLCAHRFSNGGTTFGSPARL